MDGVKICDFRARDIRIWQINSQNFRLRKIWKTWFLNMGAFSWQNATYTIQFILTIYINSEKLMLPGRCAPVEFSSWKCGKLKKNSKKGYPALILPFRTSLFRALSWNKILHMKLQSLKLLKATKDMFYKQFEFFANWQGRLWDFVNLLSVAWPTGVQLLVFFCSSVPVVLFDTPWISRCRSQHISVESSSLLHHSIYLWFICFTWWSIDELENLHADRTTVCFEPW